MTASTRFVVKGRLDRLSFVRRRILSLLKGSGVQDAGEMIALCVVEAVTNCIVHAYERREGACVAVSVNLNARRLTVNVSDTGRAMDRRLLSQRIEAPETLEETADGGRGLSIIRSVMSRVTYRRLRGQNILSMTRRCPKESV